MKKQNNLSILSACLMLFILMALNFSLASCEEPGKPPSTPRGVTATVLSSSSIRVVWNPVDDAWEYDVYYESDLSSTKKFAGSTSGTSYTHTGLQPSTRYYYFIKAINSYGESGYSSFDAATTEASPSIPSNPSSPTTPSTPTQQQIIGYTVTIGANPSTSVAGYVERTYSIYLVDRTAAIEEAKSNFRSYWHMRPEASVIVVSAVPIYR